MIDLLISSFSNLNLVNFLINQNSSFVDYEEDLSDIVSDFEEFDSLIKLGEIEYGNTDKLMVFTCEFQGELTSRSSKKAQYEIAKKVMKEDFKDGAVFVFYDQVGKFRFSFIRRNYGDKNQKFTPWKRYTYFVEPDAKTNRTFIERIGSCKFDSLDNIQEAFSVEQLTKDFYKELSNWYFWAIKNVSFPNDVTDDSDNEKYNSENIIRLITRLIFVWFLKQKGLIKNELFDIEFLSGILADFDAESETQNNYYRAILQNLFFATLNQEIDKRGFAEDKGFQINRSTNAIKNLYRYEKEFQNNTAQIMELFSQVPFLNGGLFECLDNKYKDGEKYNWDGFSRNPKYQARIPNSLFFAKENKVDLSGEYNDKKMKAVKVAGIIEILNRYNFTVEENTPVEIEVALDPELLGKVFENLLGAYNPETQETARKQTGSFYTPREIVNYMVDESLIAYFQTKVPEIQEETLRLLFSYHDEVAEVDDTQRESLIQATFDCKILDPACGSGAFPMGILQQMVHVLRKLDPDNEYWNRVVMAQAMKDFERAEELSVEDIDERRKEIEKTFGDGLNHPDYARKLHLIENCIYGVDIQSIAVQISKLRFFISLVCEQGKNADPTENFGIRPLPNLETKFVAANTLIGLEKTEEDLKLFNDDHIKNLIDKLKDVRHQQFAVANPTKKNQLRVKDKMLSDEIENEVTHLYKKHVDDQLGKYKLELKLAEKELELLNKKPDDIRTNISTDLFGLEKSTSYNFTEPKRKDLKGRIKQLNDKIDRGSDYSQLNSIVTLARQLTSWDPYDQNNHSDFFDPEWMFGLPKQEEGYFDVVIGNPPYKLMDSKDYNVNYSRYFSLQEGKIDLYRLFIEKSTIQLCKTLGVFAFITPNTFLTIPSCKKLRKHLLTQNTFMSIVNYDETVFDSASVNNVVFIIKKEYMDLLTHVVLKSTTESIFTVHGNSFLQNEKFEINIFIDDFTNNILSKITCNTTPLGKINGIELCLGEQPYHNTIHSKEQIETKFLHREYKANEMYLLELSGKNIQPYFVDSKRNNYLNFDGELYTKPDFKFFSGDRIILREIVSKTLIAAYVNEIFLVNKSCYILKSTNSKYDLKYILAILNSSLIGYWVSKTGDKSNQTLFPRITMSSLKKLPIFNANLTQQQSVKNIVDKTIDFKLGGDFENFSMMMIREIDNLVYRLYDLTYDEVKVIDPDIESKISEEAYNALEI